MPWHYTVPTLPLHVHCMYSTAIIEFRLCYCNVITHSPGGCRLRIDDDMAGMGPPMYEDQTVSEAGITQGSKLVIEPGPVPHKSQVRKWNCVCVCVCVCVLSLIHI